MMSIHFIFLLRTFRIHQPHVRIVTDHVKTITAAGVDTEAGDSYPIDRIILATG